MGCGGYVQVKGAGGVIIWRERNGGEEAWVKIGSSIRWRCTKRQVSSWVMHPTTAG